MNVFWLAFPSIRQDGGLAQALISRPIRSWLLSFATYVVAAIPVEVAWRGFALPRLCREHDHRCPLGSLACSAPV